MVKAFSVSQCPNWHCSGRKLRHLWGGCPLKRITGIWMGWALPKKNDDWDIRVETLTKEADWEWPLPSAVQQTIPNLLHKLSLCDETQTAMTPPDLQHCPSSLNSFQSLNRPHNSAGMIKTEISVDKNRGMKSFTTNLHYQKSTIPFETCNAF